MLADSNKAKSYIGQDVILAIAPSAERPGRVEIVVGHLYDYAYLGDIPFGTAYVTGFAQLEVSLGADEYQLSLNSWTFPTQQKLHEWAAGVPAHRVFIPQSLPSEALVKEVRNVIAIAPLQDGMKERYFEEANELFPLDNEQ